MVTPDSAAALHFLPPAARAALRLVHIGAGLIAVASGYVAILAPKGRPVHRAAGKIFLLAMLTMGGFASLLAFNAGQSGNLVAGILVIYLVATAWVTARRAPGTVGRFEVGAMLFAAVGAGLSFWGAYQASLHPTSEIPGWQVRYVFSGVIALLALSDLSVLLRRGLQDPARIARHLWRMCLAMFVATGSFFLGQMQFIPQALRGPHIWVLALAPLGFLIFWLIRVRFRPWNGKPARDEPLRQAA